MATAAHDIAAYLSVQLPWLTVGSILRVGDQVHPPRPGAGSALAVNVALGLGGQDIPHVDGGARTREERTGIVIRIRGDKDDQATGGAVATQIYDLLNLALVPGYYNVRAEGSGVIPLGPDADGYPGWVVRFTLWRYAVPLRVFAGSAPVPGTLDAAFILSLAPTLRTDRGNAILSATVAPLERWWLGVPASWPAPRVFLGLGGAQNTPLSITLQASGVVLAGESTAIGDVPYDLWATTALGLGALPVIRVQ